MAVYYCQCCDSYIDGDYNPMVETPEEYKYQYGDGVCDECFMVLEAISDINMDGDPGEAAEWHSFDPDC